MQTQFAEILIQILIETVLIAGILNYFIKRRETLMTQEIEAEFKKRDRFFDTQFSFKLKALEELLAPIKMQFIRSKIALREYEPNNAYRENILKECNETIRKLLLTKGHLLSSDLISPAEQLINHYDGWLQAYREARVVTNDKKKPFVFTYDFPREAESAFSMKFEMYKTELNMEQNLDDITN